MDIEIPRKAKYQNSPINRRYWIFTIKTIIVSKEGIKIKCGARTVAKTTIEEQIETTINNNGKI